MSATSGHSLVQQARSIAIDAHRGQAAKTGEPFIDHVARVAASVDDDEQAVVAWLHDVVEKAPNWTLERLRAAGFSDAVLSAVDAMTKREGEDYFDFCRRAFANPLARPVKRADLLDNIAQVVSMGGDTFKYEEALRLLDSRD